MAALLLITMFSAPPAQAETVDPEPVTLAHYYIWFDPTSWNRAKSDYPALGRYSSDQASVMRQHVQLAKSIGIDGFIVSWKSTRVLDARLQTLVEVAGENEFKLAITYQALDFNRNPLPPARVGDDLDLFTSRYGDDPVFDIFGKPLVIWSGTWEYNTEEIATVTTARAEQILILASEQSVAGYERVAEVVDGNHYHWSAVDPATSPGYPNLLVEMGEAVRAANGIWIAPVAPGFDSRPLGGETVVDRQNGATLRTEWDGALSSGPDAIGIISWNEFSENTQIEPSVEQGSTAVETIAELTGSSPQADGAAESGSGGDEPTHWTNFLIVAFVGLALAAVGWRTRRRRRQMATAAESVERAP